MDHTVYIPSSYHLRVQNQTFSTINQLHGAVSLRTVMVTLLLIKLPTYHITHVSLQCSQHPAMSEALCNIS